MYLEKILFDKSKNLTYFVLSKNGHNVLNGKLNFLAGKKYTLYGKFVKIIA